MNDPTTDSEDDQRKFRYKAGAFLLGVAGANFTLFSFLFFVEFFVFLGISAAVGFGKTLASAKKADPNFFSKGMTGSIEMADTGANLAMRALGWGTVFAFLGTGSLAFAIWKLSGAKDVTLKPSALMDELKLFCFLDERLSHVRRIDSSKNT